MIKSSCILKPAKEPLIIIHQWQLDYCNGNHTTAALISFFTYWHDYKLNEQEQNKKKNIILKEHGETWKYEESLLQFHTEDDFEQGICFLSKRDTIRKSLKFLEETGVVSIHSNPNPKYAFDRKRYFLFNPEVLNDYLKNRIFDPSKPKNRSSTQKNLSTPQKSLLTITETTTETTSDILFSFSFNLMSLETDASVREAFEKCSDEEKKYLSWDNTKCTLTVNLPKKKPIYIVSLSKMSKLSHDNLSLLISHLNPFYSHPFFEDYFTHLEGCRFQSALKITRDLDMQAARDPSEDEKDIYNLH